MLDLPTLSVHFIERLLLLTPDDMTAHSFLWALASSPDAKAAGIDAYRRLSVTDVRSSHKLAALTGEGRMAAEGDASYARKLYDDMADRFEGKLVNCLGYRGPWILHSMAMDAVTLGLCPELPPVGYWKVLDMGCGSGLVGRVFQNFVREGAEAIPMPDSAEPMVIIEQAQSATAEDEQLLETHPTEKSVLLLDGSTASSVEVRTALSSVSQGVIGVDVSENIARLAVRNGGYSEVICGDLREVLHCISFPNDTTVSTSTMGSSGITSRSGLFDMVIAADTFIYIGVLGAVFKRVAATLKANGLFLFSIEDLATSPMKSELQFSDDENALDCDRSSKSANSSFNGDEPIGAVPGWGAQLLTSARFAHSEEYISLLASHCGFAIAAKKSYRLRLEGTVALNGLFYILQKCI